MNKEKKHIVPKLRFPEFVNDEWEIKSLSSITENLSNKRVPITSNVREKGEIPYYGATGVIDYVKDYIFNENLLLISEDGANLIDRNYPIAFSICGKTWVNNHAHVLKPINEHYQTLVEKYINSISIEDYLTGQAQPKLNKENLNKIPIPLPKSPKEQQKIANCLSSLDTLITAETEKLAHLKDHKKGLLQQLFPAKGEKKPQFRFPEFVGDWKEDKLSNLILNISPPKKLKSSQFQKNGKYPIIDQSQNEIAGWSDDEEAIVKNGFPLIIFGDHTCVLKIVENSFVQGADGIKILKGNKFVDTRYLYYGLQNNPLMMKEYKRHYSILKEKLISYPDINSGEQQKIANCFSSVDDLIQEQTIKIETLKAHKKGLMQQLFPNSI